MRRLITGRPGAIPAAVTGYANSPEVFMQREGTLHIVRVNPATPYEVPEYHVGFADYQSGATRMKKVMGDETLKSFLSSGAGIPSQTIASAFGRLRSESIANIFNVALTDDTLANLGL